MKKLVVFLAGVLFSAGLVLGGMTQPSKVAGFLDFFGNWDPSLAFVMAGAIAVHASALWLTRKRSAPRFESKFSALPPAIIDFRVIFGSALFGIGWGLLGYCPGPALTSLVALAPQTILFVLAMAVGTLLHARFSARPSDEKGAN